MGTISYFLKTFQNYFIFFGEPFRTISYFLENLSELFHIFGEPFRTISFFWKPFRIISYFLENLSELLFHIFLKTFQNYFIFLKTFQNYFIFLKTFQNYFLLCHISATKSHQFLMIPCTQLALSICLWRHSSLVPEVISNEKSDWAEIHQNSASFAQQ